LLDIEAQLARNPDTCKNENALVSFWLFPSPARERHFICG